jgi:hypothetical protein
MDPTKPITFSSRIKSLEFVSFKIEERQSSAPVDPNKITFEIGIGMNVIENEKLISIISPIEIFSDESKMELLGSLQVKGEFIVENFEEIKQGNTIPSTVVATFVGVVISAARGMLRILSKGTPFESAIIPVVNPMAIVATMNSSNPLPTT